MDKNIETILYTDEGQKSFRFSQEELKNEIHRCELNEHTADYWGNDKEVAFFRWLGAELKSALDILVSSQGYSKSTNNRSQLIKNEIDIVVLVGSYTELKKSGTRYIGLCPFHSEKHPSFMVYPDTQSWYCFSCNKGGDVISFIMFAEDIDFKGALSLIQGGYHGS